MGCNISEVNEWSTSEVNITTDEMYLVPQMATALVFFIYVSNEGLEQANAQYYNNEPKVNRETNSQYYNSEPKVNRETNAQYYNTEPKVNREIRMCGPMLTNTLELVCQGRFHTMNKKAQDGRIRSQDWTNNDRENFAIFPFRSRRNALAFNGAGTFRRRTRNVADECCYLKPCTLEEMSHYCERN